MNAAAPTAPEKTTEPPHEDYYAVIFTAVMTADRDGYEETAQRMAALAQQQPGHIGGHHALEGNRELTISYWQSLAAVQAWKTHPQHRAAQELGRAKWYADYQVRTVRLSGLGLGLGRDPGA